MFADKYGRLWEGRAGGLSKAVVGAHAGGYNTGTFGISVLGTFESKAPPQKTLDAVSGAIAWKLSLSGTSADAKTTVAGERMRTVIGHRDVGTTSCPGDAFYSALGDVRSTAVAMQEGERSVDAQSDKDKKKSEDKKSDKKKSDGESKGKKDKTRTRTRSLATRAPTTASAPVSSSCRPGSRRTDAPVAVQTLVGRVWI